jgi:hypothetical protein
MSKYKYTCPKCKKYKTNRKSDYDKHLERKYDCRKRPRVYGSKTSKPSNRCPYCKNVYDTKNYIPQHIKKCPYAPENNNDMNTIDNDNTNITDNGDTNITGNNNIIGNDNIIGDNNNTNININVTNNPKPVILCVFGKDGICDISAEEIIQICTTENNIYEELVKILHCNPLKKNHHNIYCPDRKTNDIAVFTNNPDTSDGWEIKRRKSTLMDFVYTLTYNLNIFFNTLKKYLSDEQFKKIQEKLILTDTSGKTNKDVMRSIEMINQTVKDLSRILYNHKELIINTRNEIKKSKDKKNKKTDEKVESHFKNGWTKEDVIKDLKHNGWTKESMPKEDTSEDSKRNDLTKKDVMEI